MKKFTLIASLASLIFFAGCSARSAYEDSVGESIGAAAGVEEAKSVIAGATVKTYEMYSWKGSDSKFRYVILAGVQGEYSYEKITKEYIPITGTENLIKLFKELEGGEQIYWGLRQIPGFTYPEAKELRQIIKAARDNNVLLEVIAW